MLRKDKVLWHIMAIIGINIARLQLKAREKCISTLFKFVIFIMIGNWLSAGIFCVFTSFIIGGLNQICLCGFIILTWYFVNKKKKGLSKIVSQLYLYQIRYEAVTNPHSNILNIAIIATLIVLTVAVILLPFIIKFDAIVVGFFTYGYRLQSQTLKHFFQFYSFLTYYTCCSIFLLITFSLSVIFFRFSETLQVLNTLLGLKLYTKNNCKSEEFFVDLFLIIKILRKLNHLLAYPSFFIIACGLQMLFTTLYLTINVKRALLQFGLLVGELIFNFISGLLIIVIYTTCCSMVSENLIKIKETAQEQLNEKCFRNSLPQNILMYLKIIEREDTLYISACGMFHFTRGFILTTIGITLTYGLFLINFQ